MVLTLRPGYPIGHEIARGLRAAVLDGRLPPGARAPSTRQLASELGVSRTIVLVAYDQLRAEGYLIGRRGAGTYVAKAIPDELIRAPEAAVHPVSDLRPPRLSANGHRLLDSAATSRRSPEDAYRLPFEFRFGEPSPEDFPHRMWRRLLTASADQTPMHYGPSEGLERLRRAIAGYLMRARGVPCRWNQVVVVNGSQQALDVLARLLLDPRDPAVVEEPGYDGVRAVLRGVGASILPVGVDGEGLRTADLPTRGARPHLAFVTPSHQFPLGGTLPIGRRLELLAWARRLGVYVVEDDYDGEYRYAERPVEPLVSLDRDGLVIYVGTFSKVLSPVLRMGYVVLPPPLMDPFARVKFAADRESSPIPQAPLAEFIESGALERHLRRVRTRNALRCQAVVKAVTEHLGDRARLHGARAGGHFVLEIAGASLDDVDGIVARAAGVEVGVASIAPYYLGDPQPGLLLCYQGMSPATIKAGIERLASVL